MQKDNRAVNRFVVNIFSHYITMDYQLLRLPRRPLDGFAVTVSPSG